MRTKIHISYCGSPLRKIKGSFGKIEEQMDTSNNGMIVAKLLVADMDYIKEFFEKSRSEFVKCVSIHFKTIDETVRPVVDMARVYLDGMTLNIFFDDRFESFHTHSDDASDGMHSMDSLDVLLSDFHSSH